MSTSDTGQDQPWQKTVDGFLETSVAVPGPVRLAGSPTNADLVQQFQLAKADTWNGMTDVDKSKLPYYLYWSNRRRGIPAQPAAGQQPADAPAAPTPAGQQPAAAPAQDIPLAPAFSSYNNAAQAIQWDRSDPSTLEALLQYDMEGDYSPNVILAISALGDSIDDGILIQSAKVLDPSWKQITPESPAFEGYRNRYKEFIHVLAQLATFLGSQSIGATASARAAKIHTFVESMARGLATAGTNGGPMAIKEGALQMRTLRPGAVGVRCKAARARAAFDEMVRGIFPDRYDRMRDQIANPAITEEVEDRIHVLQRNRDMLRRGIADLKESLHTLHDLLLIGASSKGPIDEITKGRVATWNRVIDSINRQVREKQGTAQLKHPNNPGPMYSPGKGFTQFGGDSIVGDILKNALKSQASTDVKGMLAELGTKGATDILDQATAIINKGPELKLTAGLSKTFLLLGQLGVINAQKSLDAQKAMDELKEAAQAAATVPLTARLGVLSALYSRKVSEEQQKQITEVLGSQDARARKIMQLGILVAIASMAKDAKVQEVAARAEEVLNEVETAKGASEDAKRAAMAAVYGMLSQAGSLRAAARQLDGWTAARTQAAMATQVAAMAARYSEARAKDIDALLEKGTSAVAAVDAATGAANAAAETAKQNIENASKVATKAVENAVAAAKQDVNAAREAAETANTKVDQAIRAAQTTLDQTAAKIQEQAQQNATNIAAKVVEADTAIQKATAAATAAEETAARANANAAKTTNAAEQALDEASKIKEALSSGIGAFNNAVRQTTRNIQGLGSDINKKQQEATAIIEAMTAQQGQLATAKNLFTDMQGIVGKIQTMLKPPASTGGSMTGGAPDADEDAPSDAKPPQAALAEQNLAAVDRIRNQVLSITDSLGDLQKQYAEFNERIKKFDQAREKFEETGKTFEGLDANLGLNTKTGGENGNSPSAPTPAPASDDAVAIALLEQALALYKYLEAAAATGGKDLHQGFKAMAEAEIPKIKDTLRGIEKDLDSIFAQDPKNPKYKQWSAVFASILQGNPNDNSNRGIYHKLDTFLKEITNSFGKAYTEVAAKAREREAAKDYMRKKSSSSSSNKTNAINDVLLRGLMDAKKQKGGSDNQVEPDQPEQTLVQDINAQLTGKFLDTLKQMRMYFKLGAIPVSGIATGNNDSLFSQIWSRYVENRNNVEQYTPQDAADEMVSQLETHRLLPANVLRVTGVDKFVFVVVSLVLRLLALSATESLINRGRISQMSTAITVFLILYTVFFGAFVILVNLDLYRMRILFNYVNMHNNAGMILNHVVSLWMFSLLIFMILWNTGGTIFGASVGGMSAGMNEQEKGQLMYRLEMLTLIVWVFLAITVALV